MQFPFGFRCFLLAHCGEGTLGWNAPPQVPTVVPTVPSGRWCPLESVCICKMGRVKVSPRPSLLR